MKKLTGDKCREIIEECRALKERGYLSINGDYKLQALEIALPILEQQEQGAGEWIEWGGGDCPVADDRTVRVRYRGDFQEDKCIAGSMIWNHSGEEDDIIAYRLMNSRQQPVSGKKQGGF